MANIETLLNQLATGEYFERSSAARALGDAEDPRVPEALVTALRDEDEWVVESAAEALGRIGDPSAAPALVPLLDHRQYQVRTAAATALGQLRHPDTRGALEAHADDSDSWVREAVREALEVFAGGEPRRAATTAPGTHAAPTSRPAMDGPQSADADELVTQAAAHACARHKHLEDGSHLVRVSLANGRHQKVRIVTTETSSGGYPRLRLITVLGPATEKLVTWAMRQNLRITRGAIGVVRLRNRDHLAMTETLLLEEASVQALAAAIERIARRGDRLEQAIVDTDTW